jgi:succinate-acetate transporter protein
MAQFVAERPVSTETRAEIAEKRAEVSVPAAINPAPLGLCAFALTTFLLSVFNAQIVPAAGEPILIGIALFYGGIAQMLAGMWEFRVGNTFGGVVFTSYGAFWLAVGYSLQNHLIVNQTAFAYLLLAWTIFTAMMLLAALRTNVALITTFVVVLLTVVALTVGKFVGGDIGAIWTQVGGWLGIVAAVLAWYTALAGLLASTKSAFHLPTWPIK